LCIKPEELPVHQINIVGIALVLEPPIVSEDGTKLECTVSDYFTKEKQTETQITLFHPPKSRLRNQILIAKRGSSIFFSGALTFIENRFYVELHNFNFIYTQANSTSTKYTKEKMPWVSNSSETSMSSDNSLARTIHQKTQEQRSAVTQEKCEIKRKFHPNKIVKSTDKFQEILDDKQVILSDDSQEISDSEKTQETSKETQEQQSILGKRKTRTKKETLEETQEPKFTLGKRQTRAKK